MCSVFLEMRIAKYRKRAQRAPTELGMAKRDCSAQPNHRLEIPPTNRKRRGRSESIGDGVPWYVDQGLGGFDVSA